MNRIPRIAAWVALLLAAVPAIAIADAHAAHGAVNAAAPLKVLALGDSITYGKGDRLLNSYRADLKARLMNGGGFPIDYVGAVVSGSGQDPESEGHSGWRINQIRAEIQQYLLSFEPDVVIIHLGTNDILHNDTLSAAPARLNALINQIEVYRPSAEIFVQQIAGFSDPVLAARGATFNAGVAQMPHLADPGVHLVNQGGVRGSMLYDGVHPNTYGYQWMGWNLYQSFNDVYGGGHWYAGQSPATKTYAVVCQRNSGCHNLSNAQRTP